MTKIRLHAVVTNRRQRQHDRVAVFQDVNTSKYSPNNLPNYRKSMRVEKTDG